jgi:type IV pilus assembly protein PilZ
MTSETSIGIDLLSITFVDKNALYSAYMSFIKDGGIFVGTHKAYKLGDLVKLELKFLDEKERFTVSGKVIWITPVGAQGNRIAGVGLQFQGEEGTTIRNKIETLLAGALKSERPTNTM